MWIPSLALVALASTANAAAPTLPSALPDTVLAAQPRTSLAEHGKLTWFEGTWAELLAEAQSSKRIIFIDFWADW